MIKPALLIGTGFHHYVSGKVEAYESLAPLVSWNALIDAVGRKASLALPSHHLPPVYRWEALVHQAYTEGFNGKNDVFYEKQSIALDDVLLQLKQLVACVVTQIDSYSPSKRAVFPSDELWGSVISLNYDHAWMQDRDIVLEKITNNAVQLPEEESQRLTSFVNYGGKRVWFPNGTVIEPSSIRIGLSDFGSKAFGISKMVDAIAKIELMCPQKPLSKEEEINRNNDLKSALDGYDVIPVIDIKPATKLPVSWVSEFLFRPLAIAGCGLSESESGLWYLLRERQRFQSMLSSSQQNPVRILLSSKDSRLDFWQAQPFGIEPVFCNDWSEGWDRLQKTFVQRHI